MDVQATGGAFSPQREHPALQKMKFINFFIFLCVIFALLDPDLDCESGSRSRNPTESGYTTLLVRGKIYLRTNKKANKLLVHVLWYGTVSVPVPAYRTYLEPAMSQKFNNFFEKMRERRH
jgi:hypothetical protein